MTDDDHTIVEALIAMNPPVVIAIRVVPLPGLIFTSLQEAVTETGLHTVSVSEHLLVIAVVRQLPRDMKNGNPVIGVDPL